MKKHSEKLDFLTATANSHEKTELYHYSSSQTYIELETVPKVSGVLT